MGNANESTSALIDLLGILYDMKTLGKRGISNEAIAKILYEIWDYLHTAKVPFKPGAYAQAAKFIEHYPEEMREVYKRGGVEALEDLPEIGVSIAKKVAELIETGKLKYLEKLRQKFSKEKITITRHDKRKLLQDVLPIAEKIVAQLKNLPEVGKIEIAGPLRRKTETIGDIDVVAASKNPAKVMEVFQVCRKWRMCTAGESMGNGCMNGRP